MMGNYTLNVYTLCVAVNKSNVRLEICLLFVTERIKTVTLTHTHTEQLQSEVTELQALCESRLPNRSHL